jgi:hypothetical protein
MMDLILLPVRNATCGNTANVWASLRVKLRRTISTLFAPTVNDARRKQNAPRSHL